jgi:hypothetical protein
MWIIEKIKQIFNKNNLDKMLSEQQLISYKTNFTGQQFQWIKTDRPDLIGKVVKCKDITPAGIAVFDDGSQVHAKEVTQKLMMIHGDTKPLTKQEVEAISPSPRVQEPKIVPEVKKPIVEHTNNTVQSSPKTPKPPSANPFEMFNSDETDLSLKLKIKLPDKKLLKLMYNNAENKEEFTTHLSNYVHSMINNKVVKESLESMLSTKTSTTKRDKKTSSEITVTEVNDK